MGLNRVVLTGRLTADPELRYTQTGRARTRFSIAVNQRYRDREGNLQETTTFVPIVVWGPQAENCANYLQKGRQVAIDGRLRIDTFETQEGERKKVVEVIAQRVEFLDGRREGVEAREELPEGPEPEPEGRREGTETVERPPEGPKPEPEGRREGTETVEKPPEGTEPEPEEEVPF